MRRMRTEEPVGEPVFHCECLCQMLEDGSDVEVVHGGAEMDDET